MIDNRKGDSSLQDLLEELEEQGKLDNSSRLRSFMLDCLASLSGRVPSLAEHALDVVRQFQDGKAEESILQAERESLHRHLIDRRGRMEPVEEGAIRLAISALRPAGKEHESFDEVHWACSACLDMGLTPPQLVEKLLRAF